MLVARGIYDEKTIKPLLKSMPDSFEKVVDKPERVVLEEGVVLPKGMKKRIIKPKAEEGATSVYVGESFDAEANPGVHYEFSPKEGEPIKQHTRDLPDAPQPKGSKKKKE